MKQLSIRPPSMIKLCICCCSDQERDANSSTSGPECVETCATRPNASSLSVRRRFAIVQKSRTHTGAHARQVGPDLPHVGPHLGRSRRKLMHIHMNLFRMATASAGGATKLGSVRRSSCAARPSALLIAKTCFSAEIDRSRLFPDMCGHGGPFRRGPPRTGRAGLPATRLVPDAGCVRQP